MKVKELFDDRTIVPHEVVFGTDDYDIDCIIIKVK